MGLWVRASSLETARKNKADPVILRYNEPTCRGQARRMNSQEPHQGVGKPGTPDLQHLHAMVAKILLTIYRRILK